MKEDRFSSLIADGKNFKNNIKIIYLIQTNKIMYSILGQEATVITGHGTTDWFQIEKGVRQGCILSPCLFNLYGEYIIETLDWKKHKLESRLLGEISITSDMQMTPPLWQQVKRN